MAVSPPSVPVGLLPHVLGPPMGSLQGTAEKLASARASSPRRGVSEVSPVVSETAAVAAAQRPVTAGSLIAPQMSYGKPDMCFSKPDTPSVPSGVKCLEPQPGQLPTLGGKM